MMKKVLIIILIFLISIFIFFYSKKDADTKSNKDIAFYYEENVGNYVEGADDQWKSGEYALNVQNSICDGEKNPNYLSWNNDDNTIILKRDKDIKCSLYFDKKKKFTLLSGFPIEGSDRELTNILGTDGDFEDASAWEGRVEVAAQIHSYVACETSSNYVKHGKTSCKISGKSEYVETMVTSTNNYHIEQDHNYYVKLNSYNDSNLNVSIEYWWPPSSTDKGVYFVPSNYEHKNWKTFSYLGQNVAAGTNDIQIRIDNNNAYRNLDLYFDELIMVDLTTSYGDIIPSKEDLDNTLIYFDDTVYMKSIMGLQGEFKVSGVSDNQKIECNNDGVANVSNGVVTITGNSPYVTCYLKNG